MRNRTNTWHQLWKKKKQRLHKMYYTTKTCWIPDLSYQLVFAAHYSQLGEWHFKKKSFMRIWNTIHYNSTWILRELLNTASLTVVVPFPSCVELAHDWEGGLTCILYTWNYCHKSEQHFGNERGGGKEQSVLMW